MIREDGSFGMRKQGGLAASWFLPVLTELLDIAKQEEKAAEVCCSGFTLG